MRYIALGAIVLSAICFFARRTNASSSEWDLRRDSMGATCIVQPSESSPIGELLKTHPTRKAACQDARSRYTDDAGDKSKCFSYRPGTIDSCKKEGVDLPSNK